MTQEHDQPQHAEEFGADVQRALLAAVLDASGEGSLVFDEDLCVHLINTAARRFLGVKAGVTHPMKLTDLLSEEQLGHVTAMVAQLSGANEFLERPQSSLRFNTGSNGKLRHLTAEISAISDMPGLWLCRLQDTTKRQELRQMQLLAQVVGLATTKTNLRELGCRIVDAILHSLKADVVVLAVLEGDVLRPISWQGTSLEAYTTGRRLEGERFSEFKEFLAENQPVETDPWSWVAQDHDQRATQELVIPLVFMNQAVGSLHLHQIPSPQRESLALGEIDNAFFKTLGSYIAAALQNVMLFEEIALERVRLRTVIETIPDPVLFFNGRGEVLLFNAAATVLTGRQKWEQIGDEQHPFNVRDAQGLALPRSNWPLIRAIETGQGCKDVEYILDFGGFQRHILLNVIAVAGEEGRSSSFVATAKDITERSQQERRKDEFLSVASHELRTPLTPLVGLLHMVRRQVEGGEPIDGSLIVRAEQQTSRLRQLIESLLDMTRIENGRLQLHCQPTDVRALVKRAVDPWILEKPTLRFELELPDEPLIVELDSSRIDQVLSNVIDNATQHSLDGGLIQVEVSRVEEEVSIVILDHGAGMDSETLDRVFERFFHGSAPRGPVRSMGLGLYITREIVEQHSGRISISSELGVSTRVEVRLPLAQPTSS